jgi:tRNA(adenine34) deaminase
VAGWTPKQQNAELLLVKFYEFLEQWPEDQRMSETPKSTCSGSDEAWMRLALEQARQAADSGEVPVGALVIKNGEILGQGQNRNLRDNDPTAHAEIIALRQAAARAGNHRLTGCEIFVTIEPCAMCAGAMVHARLRRLIYGAADPKAGAVSSVVQVLNHRRLNHQMDVTTGVLASECSAVLQDFFRKKR